MKGSKKILEFTITLRDVEPKVWRRIQVPSQYSFWDFHVAIQDSMGWTDSHLHMFRVKNPETGKIDEIGIPNDDAWGEPCLAGWDVPIAKHFIKKGAKAKYEYDFGDDWQHVIVLDAIKDRPVGMKLPACLAGEQACPPEDCGGAHGYHEMLRTVSDPSDEQYEETLEWLGPNYNPDWFDPREVRFTSPRARLKYVMRG